MPKRIAKPKRRNIKYTSKAYRKYLRQVALPRLMEEEVLNITSKPGFFRRFAARNGILATKVEVRKPYRLQKYSRHLSVFKDST